MTDGIARSIERLVKDKHEAERKLVVCLSALRIFARLESSEVVVPIRDYAREVLNSVGETW